MWVYFGDIPTFPSHNPFYANDQFTEQSSSYLFTLVQSSPIKNLSACLVSFFVWASKVFNYCENGAKDAWTWVWKSVRPGGWCGMARWGASGVISPNFGPAPSSPLLCSSSPRQSLPAPSRMNGGSPGFSGQSFSFKMVRKYTCVHKTVRGSFVCYFFGRISSGLQDDTI